MSDIYDYQRRYFARLLGHYAGMGSDNPYGGMTYGTVSPSPPTWQSVQDDLNRLHGVTKPYRSEDYERLRELGIRP